MTYILFIDIIYIFRSLSEVEGAPLLPFIRRLTEIEPDATVYENKGGLKEESPSIHMFLELLELPDDDNTDIDLKQAAIYSITYLDKLVTPHLPPVTFNKVVVCSKSIIISYLFYFVE